MISQPIRTHCYGCVLCQTEHLEGDPLYTAHIDRQSKHGVRTINIRRDSQGRVYYPILRPNNDLVWRTPEG